MIANFTYALVLFVQPSPEPQVYAVFSTAEACRAERTVLVQELAPAPITVACVPRNKVSANEAAAQMQGFMDAMKSIMEGHQR